MRNKVLKYLDKTGDLPNLGIVFTGSKAVVTIRKNGFAPRAHQDCYYGPLFWLRLAIACASSYRKL